MDNLKKYIITQNKYNMITITLTVVAVIGIALLINSAFNKEEIGNSSKPNHQRVIRKTN